MYQLIQNLGEAIPVPTQANIKEQCMWTLHEK